MTADPALLTMADFYGTLAAVRSLGRAGFPVAVAASNGLGLARWSRYATSRLACPAIEDPEAFMDWLYHFGDKPPRHALLATSDDTAWLFSRYQPELTRSFHIRQPSLDAVYGLLNKQRLHDHCRVAMVAAPRSWFPTNAQELETCAREVEGPVVIKPRTQILLPARAKGRRVEEPKEIPSVYRQIAALEHARMLLDFDASAGFPVVQQFYPEAERGIYSLSGYVGEDSQVWALRAGVKVLQRPRRIGIGLCFEDAPVDERAANAVRRLVELTGFFGVFEAEFIVSEGEFLLIDFNPRFFSQMAFDHDRGLPLAVLAYHQALGNSQTLSRMREELAGPSAHGPRVYSHRLTLELMLALQGLAGTLTPTEVRGWRQWYAQHRAHCTDAALDDGDPLPAVFDTAYHLFHYVRHPRSTYRSLVRNL